MAKLLGSAPILLVSNIAASADYWRDQAGFTVHLWGDPPDFGLVHRDGARLMMRQVDDASLIRPHWKHVDKLWNVYFWVDDAKAMYQELKQRGARIDYALCEQPYGCLEFGIQDLDDHDIAFGQDLDAGP